MKSKKIIGIAIAIVIIVVIIICGSVIYNKRTKDSEVNKNTKIEVKNTKENIKSNKEEVNSAVTTEKPKMLTQKEIEEKEKEAAENQKIREEHEKKYVSLEEAQEYVATKSTELLMKKFPNEKGNENIIKDKISAILKTTMTATALKDKESLSGPTYDLNKLDVEIRPTNDCKFALNISTNKLINNSNEYIFIANDFSAE